MKITPYLCILKLKYMLQLTIHRFGEVSMPKSKTNKHRCRNKTHTQFLYEAHLTFSGSLYAFTDYLSDNDQILILHENIHEIVDSTIYSTTCENIVLTLLARMDEFLRKKYDTFFEQVKVKIIFRPKLKADEMINHAYMEGEKIVHF